MKHYALLEWPVGHSLSPQMQNAGFRACGINAAYECIAVPQDELSSCVRRMVAAGYSGCNVTIPYKDEMFALNDAVAEFEAAAAHTVNTVVVNAGHTYGYSTDGIGMDRTLRHSIGFEPLPPRMLFPSAGSATQAPAVYCARHGVRAITIAPQKSPTRNKSQTL